MMRHYDITKKAEIDLQEVISYTINKWGIEQARQYLDLLHEGCNALTRGEGNFKHLIEIEQDLYITHCEHHYILCVKRANKRPRIVAFFHERMDIIARVKTRL